MLTNTYSPTVSTGIVSGTVVDEGGTGIQGAQVTLSDEAAALSAAFLQTESTDADGTYVFHDVPTGTYTLTIEAQGYKPSKLVSITVTEDETTTVNPVVLQEESTDTALYLPTVSSNSAAVASAARAEQLRHIFLPAVVR